MRIDQVQYRLWVPKAIELAHIRIALLMTIVMLACEKSYPDAIEMKVLFFWHSTEDAGVDIGKCPEGNIPKKLVGKMTRYGW